MGGTKRSTWIGGTVLGAVVIVALAWFLAIGPARDTAAQTRDDAARTEQQNDLLTIQLNQLRADAANLETYKSDLAALQTQIPTHLELSAFLGQLDTIATAHSVTIVQVTPGAAAPFVAAEPVGAAAAPTDPATEGTDGATDDPSAQATPEPGDGVIVQPNPSNVAKAPAGLVTVPYTMTVLGTYADTLAFVNDLQQASAQLFLVTDISGLSQLESGEGNGLPATKLGDQQIVLSGFTYVLPAEPVTTDDPTAEPTPEPTTLPVPPAGKNPLVPVS
ncbi:hypothetical protein [Cellulomonas composti]|uniref:Pilus assembly protein PilO n=1 Tax=Cellulomonas composti TaxID=266130 RepID=A0A511J672_9CELL|nr:hypothetical protein [Cellulomonas composti]GEL93484.1 hypothetical protein CCO02nite_01420 [Cellulomonas composti]